MENCVEICKECMEDGKKYGLRAKKNLQEPQQFIAVDKKEKKEIKKKAKGHAYSIIVLVLIDYYPQILDFIASKIK